MGLLLLACTPNPAPDKTSPPPPVVGAPCTPNAAHACGHTGGQAAVFACASGTWQLVEVCAPGAGCESGPAGVACTAASGVADTDAAGAEIAFVPAGCQLEPSAHTFKNVTASNPSTACFTLKNSGNAPLTFLGAVIDPANAQYTITQQPKAGDIIAGVGTAGNLDGSASFQICVRYTPDGVQGNEKADLVVLTDGEPSECKSSLAAINNLQAALKLTCSDPSGKQLFAFPDAVATTAKCSICNQGPPPIKLQNVQAMAYTSALQYQVDANYKAQMIDITGNPWALFALGNGKCLDVVVNYTPQSGLPGPPAYVAFLYSSIGISNQGTIPIVAGPCTSPLPDFGPVPVRAQAQVGKAFSTTLSIANQACGPLAITKLCPYDASYSGQDPCSAPSKHFALAKPFAATTLAGFGLTTLEVDFKPANATTPTISDALFIQYCPGSYSPGTCSTGLASAVIGLSGTVELAATPKLPTASISVTAPTASLGVGQSVSLELAVTDMGGFAPSDTTYFWWTVTKRPAGSTTWIPQEFQGTSATSNLSLVPDTAGDYEVSAQVQVINFSNVDAFSPQVKATFTVK